MKKIFLVILFIFLLYKPAFAEKIPVKISLNQDVSTEIDNSFEVGDEIEFITTNDISYNGSILIRKNTPVYGVIDFVHDNGWVGDGAEIRLKTFILKDTNDKKISINFPLLLNRQYNTENKVKNFHSFKMLLLSVFRGNELNIKHGTLSFNLILDE